MRHLCFGTLLSSLILLVPQHAAAETSLCDTSWENCRSKVLTMIAAERVGLDVSFWFMDDARFSNAIVKQWQAGVPVRVIMDPRANASKPVNAQILNQLQSAGIPMRMKSTGDIAHWKGMIFAGQNQTEFSGANYSPYEYVAQTPYVDYNDEVIYFSDESDVVQSLMRRFDDIWTSTSGYADYANVTPPLVRNYPTYAIAPEFNFPPDDSYFNRLHPLLRAEAQNPNGRIDITMYRITDSRPADDLIFAAQQGIPVRLYHEPNEYRNPARIDDSYNIDRMYKAGVQIRMRQHTGLNHQKTVLLHSQGLTIFGTSNWSTASDDNQLEVNYFTTKPWMLQWFFDLFERKWNNEHVMPDGTTAIESKPFVPLPPDKPVNSAPALQATAVDPATVILKWKAGYWARQYDIYFGTSPVPPLFKTNVNLGPSHTTTELKTYTLPALQPGTTYYWQIVSKTMADLVATGPIWSFTTTGTAPLPGTPSTPSPADAATNVSTSPTLTWSATSASSYDVRFGTTNPPSQVAAGVATASYKPASLATSTQYFWQIVARSGSGSTVGPVWSFTTGTTGAPDAPPPPWNHRDIGSVGVPGSATYNNGTFTVSGSGADVWNSADAFHFVYQPLDGDGEIVARVATVPAVNNWSKAGVMIRDSLNANAAYAYMIVSAAKGTTFQARPSTGAAAVSVSTQTNGAPYWVRLVRTGTSIAAFQSPDGTNWTAMGTTTVNFGTSIQIGLAVTSHDNARLVTATFDHVTVKTATSLQAPWGDQDIGAVGAAGSASASNTTFTVAGAGADIWNTADAFHYVYQPLAGDGEIVARIASVQNANVWSKAGVMIRSALTAKSAYAQMLVSAARGSAFQYRTTDGASALQTTGTTATTSITPMWVRVTRVGSTITGYQSSDGSTWQQVGSATVTLGASVSIGLAVTAHTTAQTATAVFEQVAVTQN